jgi:hypothetical protein
VDAIADPGLVAFVWISAAFAWLIVALGSQLWISLGLFVSILIVSGINFVRAFREWDRGNLPDDGSHGRSANRVKTWIHTRRYLLAATGRLAAIAGVVVMRLQRP